MKAYITMEVADLTSLVRGTMVERTGFNVTGVSVKAGNVEVLRIDCESSVPAQHRIYVPMGRQSSVATRGFPEQESS